MSSADVGGLRRVVGGGGEEERGRDADELYDAGVYPYVDESMDEEFRGREIGVFVDVGCIAVGMASAEHG